MNRSLSAVASLILTICVCLAATPLAGCRAAGSRTGVAYQNSTIDALLDGNYDGELTFARLARRGDFGIGTFDALDGEMVALDGRFFQVRSNGRVGEVPPETLTPFSVVTFFRPERKATFSSPADLPAIAKQLDALRASDENAGDGHAFAVAVRGAFARVRTRSVPRQSPPYRPLATVVKEQATFDLEDVSGTMVGFWFPATLRHVNVPGYHFHFITDDRSAGGHVLDAQLTRGTGEMCRLATIEIALPRRAPTTRATQGAADELDQVEK